MADPARSLPPSWDPAIPPRPLRPPDVREPARPRPVPSPAADGTVVLSGEEHRRLLVGNLVVRRLTYRSVARVAWPFSAAAYAAALVIGTAAWNLAALAGWSPGTDGLDVAWAAAALGVVVVPLLVAVSLGLAALYNVISERTGGVEIAVVSPRRYRRSDPGR